MLNNGAFFLNVRTALKLMLSRAQVRLADRSDACEGPGWARTEHMQQESGYVGGVPKMAAGAEAFLEDAGCWQASLQNARDTTSYRPWKSVVLHAKAY